jgi:hypothetical protein
VPSQWLDVPFPEKDQAKAAGARWQPKARRWYDPDPPTPGLARWAALPEVPDLLPGEDREFGAGLFVDLVPESCWFTNVRSCVPERDWERLRRMIVRRAGSRCEVCGRHRRSGLEAHERWAYDEPAGTQTLRRLVCLCPDCHLVTHFGHAEVTGRGQQAFEHLVAVTGMTDEQANAHLAEAAELWRRRSRRDWTLDLRLLRDAGITPRRPPDPAERAARARRPD